MNLIAIPWQEGQRSGVAFKADRIVRHRRDQPERRGGGRREGRCVVITRPRRAEQREQQWPGLNASQADGLECVMCQTTISTPRCQTNHLHPTVPDLAVPHVPVGFSHTGSQVFALRGPGLARLTASLAWLSGRGWLLHSPDPAPGLRHRSYSRFAASSRGTHIEGGPVIDRSSG